MTKKKWKMLCFVKLANALSVILITSAEDLMLALLMRLQPLSNFKKNHLSPASKAIATQQEQSCDKAKLHKYDDLNITLEEDQCDELANVVTKLQEVAKEDLDNIFTKADVNNVGPAVRDVWESDLRKAKLEFFSDQQWSSKKSNLSIFYVYSLNQVLVAVETDRV